MALGKYSRVDGRRSSSYCSTAVVVAFVALCLVGVWMMTSSSVVPVQNDISQDGKAEVKQTVTENESRQFEDSPGDLPEDAMRGDSNNNNPQDEGNSEVQDNQKSSQQTTEDNPEENQEKPEKESGDKVTGPEETSNPQTETNPGEPNTEDGESNPESGEPKTGDGETNTGALAESVESPVETKKEDKMEGQVEENQDKQSESSSENKNDSANKNQGPNEVFPDGAQSEILNETGMQNGAWSTQRAESKNEKEKQQSSMTKDEGASGYSWKVCNVTAGPDYIPCLDNLQALKQLKSTKHYEHRERHCPEEGPTCLVPLPEGYKRPIEWPKSREKIWYYNVPHTKLAEVKGHQNWVKVTGEYLTFPGGGTQFKYGASHYIDFIQQGVPDIAWGKQSRVILDVGCGVASFGGFLFDRDVLTMSFAPKDEHEAQVQFALERGIPALSAVMGTKRLPFPGNIFDAVHCARCRVPWHIEGGKLLLELNRMLRPGGYFLWSATPVYQKLPEDVEIWNAMSELTKKMCWELVTIKEDKVDLVGAAIYRKPLSNECYEKRPENEPPLCKESDDRNAAWNVPLQACMHKVPVDASERGSEWPEQWPVRLERPPYWLKSTQVGVYGKAAPEDFTADYDHWKRVVTKSYLNGMGISWSSVRNVMDMKSVYGGFAAALKDLNVWVMNVVPIDSPDTLPIIYERGLFGIYHDWCESFSTYPRSYDLLHADHLFSKLNKRCNLKAVIAEVDRILRPEGKLIVRDKVEIINEVEKMARSLQWEVRLTYTKDTEGLLCVQKTMWRPKEVETIASAIA
ncbi:putative S-adenosyl-L-methionine-dependent methyltransferase [Macleaya cordata]|uniref:Putative S-adenosyl-L-methionine-dependent methyltransferase n=1 Tax=Macleaya cordata TaxID=56857 RepID=A0A200QBJ4_MACCD|nr:putative S-adenosyl-L-methionine-dependent methyltransferase [Macleaya cordata]